MAQLMSHPILSLCIPIYNRLGYLERMLNRFLEDIDLFEHDIALYISDNCSTDDLQSCCELFQQKGLVIDYHRNETNIGPDKNFEACFYQAKGQYVWLLGSDDVPNPGILRIIVQYLKQGDYGLVHLSIRKMDQELTLYHTSDDMAMAVGYWITFMSANIIKTESLKRICLADYRKSFMIQVPAYLSACCSQGTNAIIYQPTFFDEDTDNANNGGYNLFEVFVTNLYGIYESFIYKGLLSKRAFEVIIKKEYNEFLLDYIVRLVLFRKKSNFKIDGCWKRLLKYYGFKSYFYYGLVLKPIKLAIGRLFKL